MTYRNYRQQLHWTLRTYQGKYLCKLRSGHLSSIGLRLQTFIPRRKRFVVAFGQKPGQGQYRFDPVEKNLIQDPTSQILFLPHFIIGHIKVLDPLLVSVARMCEDVIVFFPLSISEPFILYSLDILTIKILQKFKCFTMHFFISLNDKHQNNTLRTQQ